MPWENLQNNCGGCLAHRNLSPREQQHIAYGEHKDFFPDVSLRLKATGTEVLTVSRELHQAASHLGNSMYVLQGK